MGPSGCGKSTLLNLLGLLDNLSDGSIMFDEFAITQIPLGPTLKDEFTEIEEFARLMDAGTTIFEKEEESFQEDSVYIADSTLFKVLSAQFLYSDPDKALSEPNTIVLSQSVANKYFGRTNVLGEIHYGSSNLQWDEPVGNKSHLSLQY